MRFSFIKSSENGLACLEVELDENCQGQNQAIFAIKTLQTLHRRRALFEKLEPPEAKPGNFFHQKLSE